MDVRSLKDRAADLFSARRYRKAADLLARVSEALPEDAHARLRQGDALLRLGEGLLASRCYLAAARLFAFHRQEACARAALRLARSLRPDEPLLGGSIEVLLERGPRGRAVDPSEARESRRSRHGMDALDFGP